jgi:hypothetical protein
LSAVLDNAHEVQKLFPTLASAGGPNVGRIGGPLTIPHDGEVVCRRCGEPCACDARTLVYEPEAVVCLELECRQCQGLFFLVWYKMTDKTARTVLLQRFTDSVFSPNAPPEVAYYCEQARLGRSVGANSAAVVMFRAAIEQVLADKGCTARTCGGKLAELEKDLEKGNPKADWAKSLDTELIRQMKIIGDGGTHGDAKAIVAYDGEMVDVAEVVVRAVLHFVYEAPKRKSNFEAAIRAKADIVKQ